MGVSERYAEIEVTEAIRVVILGIRGEFSRLFLIEFLLFGRIVVSDS